MNLSPSKIPKIYLRRILVSAWKQACVPLAAAEGGMKHLAGAWHVWPALLMLGAVGCIHARGKKLSCSIFIV